MSVRSQTGEVNFSRREGRVLSAAGPIARAHGQFSIGEVCEITRISLPPLKAEVIGFDGPESLLTPYGSIDGISHHSRVIPHSARPELPIMETMSGLVLDALGLPLFPDGIDQLPLSATPIKAFSPDPMTRISISDVFETGVRAIDSFLTVGVGQRVGIFAAAGGGKSTLLSMLVRFSEFDHCVVALIGERGREVREFVEETLGEECLEKSTLFVATADRPAIEQVNAAYSATALAEFYRNQGKRVLLLVDSVTRFARAQRQIGLSAGEPPTRRGFPPSVFEKLPTLFERAGNNDVGSITAFYTVLVEGDDMSEPVADEVRSLLDGHIILSRQLAESGHYPAIDVLGSVSRTFNLIANEQQKQSTRTCRRLLSKYKENELIIQVGEYEQGADRDVDQAIRVKPRLDEFLQQDTHERAELAATMSQLNQIVA